MENPHETYPLKVDFSENAPPGDGSEGLLSSRVPNLKPETCMSQRRHSTSWYYNPLRNSSKYGFNGGLTINKWGCNGSPWDLFAKIGISWKLMEL